MNIEHPTILLLLWLLPGVAALLFYAQRKRLAAARQFVQDSMMARLMPPLGGPRPWIRGALVLLGLALVIVAAARPRFGVYYEKVPQRGVDCVVLLDVSRSMLAEDVAPNRLERAKLDIRDVLKKMAGDRVGLIVFAGKPVLNVPLTTDDGFFRTVLDDVNTRSAPRGGTLIGDAIRKALDALPKRGDRDQVLVLLTDGEDQESYPIDAAKIAAERGVKVFTVGLGDSTEGARIPVRDSSGNVQYVKEEGKEHWSKADQSVLKQIAELTGGVHIPAGTTDYDLGQILADRLSDLARGEDGQEAKRKLYHERYQIFLAFGLILLAAELLIAPYPADRQRRPSTSRKRTADVDVNGNHLSPTSFRPIAPSGTATVALLVAVAAFGVNSPPAYAVSHSAASNVAKGIEAFREGDFKKADDAFAEAAKSMPKESRIAFDRGCALAAEKKTDDATEQFLIAAASTDRRLAAAANYNLGCLAIAKAKAALGKQPEEAKEEVRKEAIETLSKAADHLRGCLAIDPQHADARYNLEAIRLWVKHIEEVWRRRDLEKSRREMSLPQFLQMLETKQRELRAESRKMTDMVDSPLQREALRTAKASQQFLADEIEPLKEKLRTALTGGTGSSPQASPHVGSAPPQIANADVQRALSLLGSLLNDLRSDMAAAVDSLDARKPGEAVRPQTGAVEKIDNLFIAVAPFVEVVKKGIAAEEGLMEQSKQGKMSSNDAKQKKQEKTTENNGEADWPEAAWNQRFISGYGRVLAAKAKQELEQMAKPPAAPNNMPQPGAVPNGQPTPEQQKELKRALQAGVELAPKVETLSDRAATSLDAAKPAEALPPQEEALELLKKMLPKDEQKNEQNNKNQDKKDQDKNNQDKKDQQKKDQDKDKKDKDKKDQDKKDQQKKDQGKKDKDKKDQQKKDKQKQDQKKDQQKQAGQPQPQDVSKQKAEAGLRRVRQRQQERRDMEKILLEKLYQPDKVDKDW